MKKILFILLPLVISPAHAAEVFKCQLKSGKMVYQSLPCEAAVKQQTIEIQEPDPHKIAEEEAKLKAWKEDFAVREAARIKAEQEQQAELDRQASVEALRKSAEYQKRQAEALEQRNIQPSYQQYQYYPSYYPPYPSPSIYPYYPSHIPHQHDTTEKTVPESHQSGQSDLKIRKDSDSDNNSSKNLLMWK